MAQAEQQRARVLRVPLPEQETLPSSSPPQPQDSSVGADASVQAASMLQQPLRAQGAGMGAAAAKAPEEVPVSDGLAAAGTAGHGDVAQRSMAAPPQPPLQWGGTGGVDGGESEDDSSSSDSDSDDDSDDGEPGE